MRSYILWPETFKGYSQIGEVCRTNNPPIKLGDYQIRLNIYKIDQEFVREFVEKYYDPNYKITGESENIWH